MGMQVNIIDDLVGKTFKKVEAVEDSVGDVLELNFHNELKSYSFYHDQDCCEHVRIVDITGDLSDLEGSPLTMAEESSGAGDGGDSSTWTFYKFATEKGYVTIRWLGESNGYYSETVTFGILSHE